MNTITKTCGTCGGIGKVRRYKTLGTNENGYTGFKQEDSMCPECGGGGYLEVAEFTVDEAKAILKFCGLSTES